MRKQPVKRAARKRRGGRGMMIMGLLLMAAALFLACMNLYEERQGEMAASSVMEQLKAVIPAAEQEETLPAPQTLIITDADGIGMSWPARADGTPMAWPVDESGQPLSSVTDEQGNVHFWPTQMDAQGNIGAASAAEWKRDESGALLPFVGDDAGRVVSWPTDGEGRLLSWEALAGGWADMMRTILEQLIPPETPAFIRHPEMEMPVSKIDGRYYVGVLEVPEKNLRLPIMSDWNEQDLKISPCRYEGSVYSGDMVIAGHNYYRHFSPIKWLENGTEVRFTDMDGNVFVYEVIGRETVAGDDVEGMLAGEWDMTLFTCTTGGQSRVAIRCKIAEIIPA